MTEWTQSTGPTPPAIAPLPPTGAATAPLTAIRFRDFLFPQRLLVETRAEENPLTLHNRRRMARPWRRVVRLLWETGLLLAIIVFLVGDVVYKSSATVHYSLFAFAWLLLRYHLFVNDQSSHLKSMTPGQLEHLVLTNLNRDDYFLHQFLFFCLRYWVAVACVAVGAALTLYRIVTLDYDWVWWNTYRSFFMLFSLILLTWAVGAIQYVIEWQLFVGGNRTRCYLLVTTPLSLLLAGFCFGTVVAIGALRPAWWIAVLGIGIFLLLARIALAMGRSTHAEADDWILAPFVSADPDWSLPPRERQPRAIGMMLDLMLPWRWRRARHAALATSDPAEGWASAREWTWDVFVTVFVHTILFACLYAVGCAVLLPLMASALHGGRIPYNPQVNHFIGGTSALPAMFAAFWVFHVVRKTVRDGDRNATVPPLVGLYGRWLWLAALASALLGGIASLSVYLGADWNLSALGAYPLSTLISQILIIAGLGFLHDLGLCLAILAGCLWAQALARRAGRRLPMAILNPWATLVAVAVAIAFYLARTAALRLFIGFGANLRGWLADLHALFGFPLLVLIDLLFVFLALLMLRHAMGLLARAERRRDRQRPPAP